MPLPSLSGAHPALLIAHAQPGPYPPVFMQNGAPPLVMDHGYLPTNGVPHGLPPPGPPPLPFYDQNSEYMLSMMENHLATYPPAQQQPMYPQYPSADSTSQLQIQRKKQMRATQACEQCRQRRQRCDEGSPCLFCKENSLSCQYSDTPPAKTDKKTENFVGYMEAHASAVSQLTSRFDGFDLRMQRLEDVIFRKTQCFPYEAVEP